MTSDEKENDINDNKGETNPSNVVDITPNYKAMFEAFIGQSRNQSKGLIDDANNVRLEPLVCYSAVHTLLYYLNMALQTATDTKAIETLRDVFSNIVADSAKFVVATKGAGAE